ncbi:MAG: ParB/Srx family N-terminal domain-containing protein [Nocardioides sp.]
MDHPDHHPDHRPDHVDHWEVIADERRALAAMFAGLDPRQLATPACAGCGPSATCWPTSSSPW